MKNKKVPFNPLVLGVKPVSEYNDEGIQAAFSVREDAGNKDSCGIVIFNKNPKKSRIDEEQRKMHYFPEENKIGRIRYDIIDDVNKNEISYLFFEGEKFVPDKYAESYLVEGEYGKPKDPEDYKAIMVSQEYDWENVEKPKRAFRDSIIYCLHVRGFTKHISSGVKSGGTFTGIIEKIPYLKELGITTIDLQPCYEFDEMDIIRNLPEKEYRVNYWGYKEGYYFAPKSAYAFTDDVVKEFKDMVKACHKNGIEVFMQFYFPETVLKSKIIGILRHWAHYYRVDGFHFMNPGVPMDEIIADPYLEDIKFINFGFSLNGLCSKSQVPRFKDIALYDDYFMTAVRRSLKGDGDVLTELLYRIRRNPPFTSQINYIADHSGFSMMDMVSYNKKHNEENGENGNDGTEKNYSWNCGEEGPTKSRQILALRKKQLKNAFVMLFMAQGTPLLYMGDEFCNSQNGNNNPYCQDNEISWLDWNDLKENEEIFDFVKRMIKLRCENTVFHLSEECTMKDYLSCGYPDLSYHNEQAWMPVLNSDIKHIAIMLCGDYAEGGQDTFWYIAMNMDWRPNRFVLPDLKKGLKWSKYMSTEVKEISEMEDRINKEAYSEELNVTNFKNMKETSDGKISVNRKGMQVFVAPRSIAVYIGKK